MDLWVGDLLHCSGVTITTSRAITKDSFLGVGVVSKNNFDFECTLFSKNEIIVLSGIFSRKIFSYNFCKAGLYAHKGIAGKAELVWLHAFQDTTCNSM
jgi:hypothetical protein